MTDGGRLQEIYKRRFEADMDFRERMWKVLCTDYFSRWVPPDSTVLEIAAGYCHFINNIPAARKIAVDLNPDVKRHAAAGVETLVTTSTDLGAIAPASVDRVFVSNFFEHISKDDILATLREAHRVLRPDGRLLVLQPNIRFCARDYWMFFDHVTPIDDRSLAEAMELSAFEVDAAVVRFLPYTTKSRLPNAVPLVRAYLRVPVLWRFLGAQTFMVARPAAQARPRAMH